MPYKIKNANSAAPAETISDEQFNEMKKAGKLRGYDWTKVESASKPAELTAKADKADKSNKPE